MSRDNTEVIAAKNKKALASCSPVSGSCFSLSCLTVVATGAFSSFLGESSVTTAGAGFSVSLGRTYSGRVTTGGASVPTELCFVQLQSLGLELELIQFELPYDCCHLL